MSFGKLLAKQMLAGRVINLAAVAVELAFSILVENFIEGSEERRPEDLVQCSHGIALGWEMRSAVFLN